MVGIFLGSQLAQIEKKGLSNKKRVSELIITSASFILVVEVVMEVRPPMLVELIKGFNQTYKLIWRENVQLSQDNVAKTKMCILTGELHWPLIGNHTGSRAFKGIGVNDERVRRE